MDGRGDAMSATTVLRFEHEKILAVIDCIRAACSAETGSGNFDVDTFRQGVDFIRNYADAWHHAKEEVHLFPALETAGMPREGGPIGVMLHEHEIGRAHVRTMAENLDAAAGGDGQARATVVEHALAYSDLLVGHIQKEDGILFEMADRVLPPDEHQRLEKVYESAIPEGATAETGARYERIAGKLCERWKLEPDELRSRPPSGGCHGF
jgi:hemerythrin-like domain-containing protein